MPFTVEGDNGIGLSRWPRMRPGDARSGALSPTERASRAIFICDHRCQGRVWSAMAGTAEIRNSHLGAWLYTVPELLKVLL